MTQEKLERANAINEELEKTRKQLTEINNSLEKVGIIEEERPTLKSLFKIGFVPKQEYKPNKYRNVAYVFYPECLRGIQFDLDKEFILLLKKYLEEKEERLKAEMEEI